MSRRQWIRLARVYVERLTRPIILSVCTLIPVCLLFARKDGSTPQAVLRYVSLIAAMLPFTVGGIITRSKADGSLAFLASLPVSRQDHARSWCLVVVLLSLPIAAVVMAMCYLPPVALRGVEVVAAGLAATLLTASAVMTMNALQLSVQPSMAAHYFLLGMIGVVGFIVGVGELFELSASTLITAMRKPWFFPVLSTSVWAVAAAAFTWAWRRIGHYMTSYVGEPPKA